MKCLHCTLALKAGIIRSVSRASCPELRSHKKAKRNGCGGKKTNEIHAGGPGNKCSGNKRSTPHLGAIKADDSVDVARAVVEVGDGDSVLAAGQPVLLGVGVDLEDVSPRAVDGLLPEGDEEEVVNLLVPQYQRLAEATARAKGPVADGGVGSP